MFTRLWFISYVSTKTIDIINRLVYNNWLVKFYLATNMITFINEVLHYICLYIFVRFMTHYVNDQLLEPKQNEFFFQLQIFCIIEMMGDDQRWPLEISVFVFQTKLLMAVKNESTNLKLYICVDGHWICTSSKNYVKSKSSGKIDKIKIYL